MSDKREIVTFEVRDANGTRKLAETIAGSLRGRSACIELVGDVGAGKTTFTQYLVAGLGSDDHVTSPTFTLENVYKCSENVVHHFDLYRLQEAGLIPEEVREALEDTASIVIIEWADILHENSELPEDRLILSFELMKDSESARRITINASQGMTFTGEEAS